MGEQPASVAENSVVDDKIWWKSKTILISTVLGVLMAVSVAVPQAKVLYDWINTHGALIGGAWSVLAIVLRSVTKGAVVLKDE